MKIAVLVKEVPDVSQIKIDPATQSPRMEGVPPKVNLFDKNAVEEAVRAKEKMPGSTITVIAFGGTKVKELVKEPLAMGADSAVIVPGKFDADGRGIAKAIAALLAKTGPYDLVFAGEVSEDRNAGEVPGRVAAALGMPLVYNAKKMKSVAAGKIVAVRDADVDEEIEVPLPALVVVNDEINQPRLPALMQILSAGKKPIQEKTLADLGLDAAALAPRSAIVENKAPKTARKQQIFKGPDAVERLAEALAKEGIL